MPVLEKKPPRIWVGADPELFLRSSNGQMVSAHDLLPGTKEKPFKVNRGAIQVDGTAAEFNITPADMAEVFVHNCQVVMNAMKEKLPNHTLVIEPTVTYDEEYWKSLPDYVKELGCNPDYNAWTGQINPKPDDSKYPRMRTASGHVHIGWGDMRFDVNSEAHFKDCCIVARQMDYYLGIQSMIWDKDSTRRSLYGKAGAFRPKSYGVEYRTMSNMWLSNPQYMNHVFIQARQAIKDLFNNYMMEKEYKDAARQIIDEDVQEWWNNPTYEPILRGGKNFPYGFLEKSDPASHKTLKSMLVRTGSGSYTMSADAVQEIQALNEMV